MVQISAEHEAERAMQVPVTEAEGQLTELVRRTEAGEEIILTRHGHAAVRLEPIRTMPDRRARRAMLDGIRQAAAGKPSAGPKAECSQDFLHGEDGLPR